MNDPTMESDIHDNCSGNRWSSCKNLNGLPLDYQYQGYTSISREKYLAPCMNKGSALMYNPCMALSYSQDHHLHDQQPTNGRDLWPCQGQQFGKRKSNVDPPYSFPKPFSKNPSNSKHLHVSTGATSAAGDLPLQPSHRHFPPFEIPLQQTQALFPHCEESLVSCDETDQNLLAASNLCLSNHRTSLCVSNSPIVTSTRKRRKNPLPKKRLKCFKKDFQVKKKRCRNEDSWLRNLRKRARAKGESYVSVVGKTVPARSVKPVDCSKCKFDCQSRVTEKDRQKLFNMYWGLETFKEKVDFICNSVQEFAPLRPKSGKRAYSRRYKLHVNGHEERVCKEFFTSTFDVHESTIGTYMSKKRKDSITIQDLRGKRAPSNKTPDSVLRKIREHVLSQVGLQSSFDKAPSEEIKSVKQLYALYELECNEENVKPAGVSVYRKVFTDMHKGENAKPITLPPEKDFNQGMKNSQDHSDWISKDTGTKETSTVLASEEASCDDQIGFPHCVVHHNTMKVPACNQSDCPCQQTEMSTAADSIDFINKHVITPCVKTKISLHSFNVPVFASQHNHHCIKSQDILQYGSLEMPTFHHQNFHSHQPMQFSVTCSNKDGNDCSCNGNDQPMAVNLPPSSESLSVNYHAHGSQTSNENCVTLNSHQPSHITCSEDNPKSILPKHISSLQDNEDINVNELSQTAGSNSFRKQKSSNSNASERAPRDVKEDIVIDSQKSKTRNEVKKRQRNEEQWARNVRKRLRFKGEEYTSVTGKKVEARRVQVVDCSKCKFKCPTKVSEEQREQINSYYWSLDSYEKKVAFIAKHVQTYQPKRKMTGRRAFSRNYSLEVDHKEVRVCKDFFQATLHVGQSTVATSLEKTRRGPDAVKELRGKRSPVNKTPDAIVQDICELVIYVTGLRPHRSHENNVLGHNVTSLYQAYVYNAEMKGNKVASVGVFRSVLQREFGLSGVSKLTKIKKIKKS